VKTIIYQLLPRYWGDYSSKNVHNGSLEENGCGHFADIDDKSLDYIKGLGCTHVWYTGVIRHACSMQQDGGLPSHPQIVKGGAGSPYAIYDYYDVNPYLASDRKRRMEEFEALIERTHAKGLKVILDFVPNHVSRDNVNFGKDDDKSVHWKAENDFFYYPGENLRMPSPFVPSADFPEPYYENPARATGNNSFSPSPSINDWYETVKLNYCDFHTGTWDKMLDILKFWASKGVDGFRCDMVELVNWEFFAWLIPTIKQEYPDLTFIAEVYKKELYRKYVRDVGFDLLYDKSGLYDCLHDILMKNKGNDNYPVGLWQSTRRITANWQYLSDLQTDVLNFLENHDELRITSDFFVGDVSKTYAALAVSALFNNAPFMLYQGQEVGEKGMYEEGFSGCDGRSSIFDWWKIESLGRLWKHIHGKQALDETENAVLARYKDILKYAVMDEFSSALNYDLCYCNVNSQGFDIDRHFAFLRYNDKKCWIVVCNFSQNKATMTLEIPLLSITRTVEVEPYDYYIAEL